MPKPSGPESTASPKGEELKSETLTPTEQRRFELQLGAICARAQKYSLERKPRSGLFMSNEIVADYFRLRAEYAKAQNGGEDNDETRKFDLFADYTAIKSTNLTVPENRQRWRGLEKAIGEGGFGGEIGILRQNFERAARFGDPIPDCPIGYSLE